MFGVEGLDREPEDQVLVKSLAEGAETSGPAVPVFATAAPASRRPRGRQDYTRQAMASKSVNRIENPPRDATYADFLESNPEPATSVIPRACGRVFGAIAGGEPLNVVVPRWMGLMCEDQLLCVAQCAPHMRSLPDDNVRRATEVPRSMREAGVRPLSVEERFGDVGSVLREQSVQAIPFTDRGIPPCRGSSWHGLPQTPAVWTAPNSEARAISPKTADT